jgi:hypothetical protein
MLFVALAGMWWAGLTGIAVLVILVCGLAGLAYLVVRTRQPLPGAEQERDGRDVQVFNVQRHRDDTPPPG